jgi:predicted PurR-regulated permease PerM
VEKEGKSSLPIEIAWKTIFKVLLGILLAFLAIKLWPLCELLIVSILLAVPLYRLVRWAGRKGWPHWASLLLAMTALVLGIVAVAAVAGPLALRQATTLQQNLPKLVDQVIQHLPPGPVRNAVERAARNPSAENIPEISRKIFDAAKFTLGGLFDGVLVLALAIYLIVDGPRALEWLIAFFPRERRARVARGLDMIGDRVVAYIIGQSIVSGCFATFTFIVLSMLDVPMALLLALLAGVLDVVPVLGISIIMALAGVIALTVSPSNALIVVALLGAYHGLENYFIIPKVYGKQLRISTLAVLVSMMAGGVVAGVIGAVAILPLVAAYPALEELWLSRNVGSEVVEDHQEQLRAA